MMDREQDLLKRLVKRDETAFREIVERLEKPLLNFIYGFIGDRSLSEDIFQETFIRVVKTVGKFKPKAELSTWIFTIARNLCLDHIKYTKRHKTLPLEGIKHEGEIVYFDEVMNSYNISPPNAALEKKEKSDFIRKQLLRLSPKHREVLILRVYLDLPYSEITKIINIPIGTAKYRVHEGLKTLAKLIKTNVCNNMYERKKEESV
jgi:RNA polymerase sigma-70 factor (ECF subfamily)